MWILPCFKLVVFEYIYVIHSLGVKKNEINL